MLESGNLKSRIITILITILIFNIPSLAKYSGGTGEPNDPYRIATYQDLIGLGNTPEDYNDCFVMTGDIDLSPKIRGHKIFDNAVIAPDINGNVSFSGIPFAGVFDGNGYTISNLTIEGKSFLGLFGSLKRDSQVKNLRIADVNIIGSGYHIGSLVGNNSGNLINCSSNGSVKGYWYVGGLIGDDRGGYIDSCSYSGLVNGYWEVGGLTGGAGPGRGVISGLISNSFSASDVNGTGPYIGGLVGYNSSNVIQCYSIGDINGNENAGGLVGTNIGTIRSSYCAGKIIGNAKVGGLVGENFEDIENCFWDVQDSNTIDGVGNMDPDPNGAMGRTTSEMQAAYTFTSAGWDFVGETTNGPNDIWKIVEGKTYPLLSWQKYSGGTGEPNDPYKIATYNDLITLSQTPEDYNDCFILINDIDLNPKIRGRKIFDKAVIASYDNTNSTLEMNPFGGIFDGNGFTISNLTIDGNSCLGLFGILAKSSEIKNLKITEVEILGSGDNVGGLAGYNAGGNIINCCSTGSVKGFWFVGGLVGYDGGGYIESCYSSGNVYGYRNLGGLIGMTGSIDFATGSINNSYSACTVVGTGNGLGSYVGGLVGLNNSHLIFCYSVGKVTGNDYVGGLVGRNRVTNNNEISFWDVETSGQTISDIGTGKTTSEMQTQSTFIDAGWDFIGETNNGHDDIWWIDEGVDYPRLWWELISKE